MDAATPLSLWLPGEAARAVIDDREGVKEAERVFGDFAKRLRGIDSRFCLYLHQGGGEDLGDLRAGFYYLLRHNEDGTWASFEIRNPDGSFREPDDKVLEAVRYMDSARLRSPRWERENRRRRQRREEEHRKRFESEERQARLLELADHRFRLQIPVPDSVDRIKEN